jgi:hypothetical protein
MMRALLIGVSLLALGAVSAAQTGAATVADQPGQVPASPAIASPPALPPQAPERPAGTAAPGAAPRPAWVFQAATGSAYQLHSRLVIEQDGQEDLDFNAEYATHPFTSGAPYYSFRLGRWKGTEAWELETHHHLVTLDNNPPEVGSFSLTHGYNLNTVNRAWLARGLVWRLGAGIVITHPESVVRGERYTGQGFAQGFSLSGVCGQAGLEKRLPLWKGAFLSLEGKFTAAWARVPIENGHATVPNYALHGLVGLGYTF